MKLFIVVLAVLAVTTFATAAVLPLTSFSEITEPESPIRLEDVDTDGGLDRTSSLPNRRFRRLTCDLFSFESGVVTPNHAPCAMKCIGMGRKGGHCEGTNCVCRSDSWTPW